MLTMTPRRTDTHLALVERVRDYIDRHADEPLPLVRLAREAGVSPAHLQRTFTRVVGLSPKQYQEQRRVGVLKIGAARWTHREQRDVRGRLCLGPPRVRDGRRRTRHDAGCISPARRRRDDPLHGRADVARAVARRRYRARHLQRVARRRRGVARRRIARGASRARSSCARPTRATGSWTPSSRTWKARRAATSFRSTCAPRPSSGRCGARCSASPRARRVRTRQIARGARPAVGRARGGARLREQPGRGPHPLSSRRARRRRARRLSLGRRAEGRAARS